MAPNPLLWLTDEIRRAGWRLRLPAAEARGKLGEDLAHRYLQRQGYLIVGRNVRVGAAELDLVARQGELLVVVEVKTRSNEEFGAPERNVDQRKRRALRRAAAWYAQWNGIPWENVRFDLISVVLKPKVEIRHAEAALQLGRR